MKRVWVILTLCCVVIIGGIITTYLYLNYADYITYQNGIFVNGEGNDSYEATDYLYKSL